MGFLSEVDFMSVYALKSNGLWPLSYCPGEAVVAVLKKKFKNKFITGAEIGVCRGETSFTLLDSMSSIKTLHAVDPYLEYEDWIGTITQRDLDEFKKIAIENNAAFGKRWRLIEKTSIDAAVDVKDNSLDFVFIDGVHTYEGVFSDIVAWSPKIKSGGLLMGHDYNMDSVRAAISDANLATPTHATNCNVWYNEVLRG